MALDQLQFTPQMLTKPRRSALTAETTLQHFVIVTYLVDPAALRPHVHPRFELDCITPSAGPQRALVSVVTFLDCDFRFAIFPWFKRQFGQTNYRAYVKDTVTGEHVAWFFGTCLDSLSVAVPRYAWQLPWHRARMTFDCRFDATENRYTHLEVRTRSRWAPAHLEIEDSGDAPRDLLGFTNLEAGLALLTHPMRGFYFRRDGALGSYSIWHDRIAPTIGTAKVAEYDLLQRLGLVQRGDCRNLHSILIHPSVDFAIYLPPHRCTVSDTFRPSTPTKNV